MGRAVQERARQDGHVIGTVLGSADAGLTPAALAERLRGHDAAIDFSVGAVVPRHVAACVQAGIPLVEGTTGWQAEEEAVRRLVEQGGGALLYGANFSVGVNLFVRVVDRAGELLGALAGYDPFIEEAHHRHKRDAPSGTARLLARTLEARVGHPVAIASTRAGAIPGIHRVGFDGAADHVVLTHVARSRDGFAAGALLGARWIAGRRGVFAFGAVLDDLLTMSRQRA
jgi:4-hydroxy-tetrahydrodipicolinate reductase